MQKKTENIAKSSQPSEIKKALKMISQGNKAEIPMKRWGSMGSSLKKFVPAPIKIDRKPHKITEIDGFP